MTWFRVDDTFHSSRKVKAIPRAQRLAAIGLWTLAGTWCAQEERDGEVPSYIVEDFAGEKSADWLVRVGLWDATSDGFRFHDWDDYQPTKAQLDERRERERQRLADKRATKSGVASNTNATPPRVDSVLKTPSRPVPSQTDITHPGQNVTLVTARDDDQTGFIHAEAEKLGIKSLGRIRKAVSGCLPILAVPTDEELIDLTRAVIDLSPQVVRHPEAYVETTVKQSPHEITSAWAGISRPGAAA